MKCALPAGLLLAALALEGAEVRPLHKLGPEELTLRLQGDGRAVLVQRQGLRRVIAFLESRPDLFPAKAQAPPLLLRREDKQVVWNTWQQFLDYLAALESAERYHAAFGRLKGQARADSFLIGTAAFLARYRAALDFIARAEHHPELHKILNDPVPELGLPGATYSRLKFEFLNVALASRFAAREALLNAFPEPGQPALREAIRADAACIWKAGQGRGQALTARNALRIVQDGARSAWLPVQAGVAEWMGDTRIYRAGASLVSPAQIHALRARLVPGDVLLERREWYLSNIGLPGFWSHAALFIGTPEERRKHLGDEATRAWIRRQSQASSTLEDLLQERFPKAYRQSLQPQEAGHEVRVLEAMSEGVSFTTLEHSAACDSLAVLRPRLPPLQKARALVQALEFAGRPYDFDFDFSTDSALVCTELIYKAYQPATGFEGLRLPLTSLLGRPVMPANDLARLFDQECGSPDRQFDLVLFLDGQERQKRAAEASLAAFRQSWRRPKWHVLTP